MGSLKIQYQCWCCCRGFQIQRGNIDCSSSGSGIGGVVAVKVVVDYLFINLFVVRSKRFFLLLLVFEVEWFVEWTCTHIERQRKVCWLIIISNDCSQRISWWYGIIWAQIWPSNTQYTFDTHAYRVAYIYKHIIVVIWFVVVTILTFRTIQFMFRFGICSFVECAAYTILYILIWL